MKFRVWLDNGRWKTFEANSAFGFHDSLASLGEEVYGITLEVNGSERHGIASRSGFNDLPSTRGVNWSYRESSEELASRLWRSALVLSGEEMEYKVIQVSDNDREYALQKLMEEVNSHLVAGWKLQGSVSFTFIEVFKNVVAVATQAIVRDGEWWKPKPSK